MPPVASLSLLSLRFIILVSMNDASMTVSAQISYSCAVTSSPNDETPVWFPSLRVHHVSTCHSNNAQKLFRALLSLLVTVVTAFAWLFWTR